MARGERQLDRAIQRRQRGIRRATGAIVLAGIGLVLWTLNTPERRQERRAGGVHIGDDTARITERFAVAGRRCSTGALEHLRDRFPSDFAPATSDALLERLRAETVERRVIPLPYRGDDCLPDAGSTEIGVDRAGRVLWLVPVTGRTPLRLPDDLLAGAPVDA